MRPLAFSLVVAAALITSGVGLWQLATSVEIPHPFRIVSFG
jgi:hypothetical protein